jgi:adenylate cyclase
VARAPSLLRSIRRQGTRVTLLQAVGLAMAATALVAFLFGLLRPLELGVVDAHFSLRGKEQPPKDIVVVKIDDATFDSPADGGLGLQWPFPRSVHARLIDRLHADGAKVIAIDIQFTEPTVAKEDNALIDAVGRAGNVVLATTEVDENGRTNIFGGDEVLREIGARPANANFVTDPGGTIRRMPYELDKLKSFGVVTAEVARARPISRSEAGSNAPWIDYAGPPGTIASISYSRVARGQFPRGFFSGKVVVVGPSAPSLQDVHPTSTSGNGVMAGAEIQANAVNTALRGFPLDGSSRWFNALLIVVVGLIPSTASLRLTPLRGVGMSLVLAGLYAVGTQFAFDRGLILPFVYPLGALLLAAAGSIAVHYVLAAFERERVRAVFARFVPEAVVNEVLEATDDNLRLGGVRRTCTIMFSDLRGFTTFAETRPAEQVITILNRYLSEMTAAILEHGGTLVSYMGDGIMAVFGAPLEQPDHADRALAAACDMLDERLPRFNDWMRSDGLGEGFRMGIGLNSGAVMAGNVGSERRLEYTTIGDVTNTASRIEGLTKGTPHMLFVAESTVAMLTGERPELVFVDEFEVRGRQGRIRLWSRPEPSAHTEVRETVAATDG